MKNAEQFGQARRIAETAAEKYSDTGVLSESNLQGSSSTGIILSTKV
jgi:hypothetical protein